MLKASRRIYVANIPQDFTEDQVRDMFDVHGELAGCELEQDRMNPPKLSAFVTFATRESVENALVAPPFEVAGEALVITPATSQKQQLFVGGYDLYVTQEQLEEFFGKFGQVDHILMKYNNEGVSRCFGFVTYRDSPDTVRKLATKRFIPCLGKTVEVKLADPTLCPKTSSRPSRPSFTRRGSNRSSSLASLDNFIKRRSSSASDKRPQIPIMRKSSSTEKRPRIPSLGSMSESVSSASSDDTVRQMPRKKYVAPHRWKSLSRSMDIDQELLEHK